MDDDVIRFTAIVLALVAASQIPGILTRRVPGWRAWVVVAAIEVLLLSKIAGILSRLDSPIVWWGTPATILASALILLYVLSGTAFWQRRRSGI